MLRIAPFITCSVSGKTTTTTSVSSSPSVSPVTTRRSHTTNADFERLKNENVLQAIKIGELQDIIGDLEWERDIAMPVMGYTQIAMGVLSTVVLGAMAVSGVGMV